MKWIHQGKQLKLTTWLNEKKSKAKKDGKEFFLGIPDEWYETELHFCNNGHISTRYLKCEERGTLCLGCGQPSHIFPGGFNEEELKKELENVEVP